MFNFLFSNIYKILRSLFPMCSQFSFILLLLLIAKLQFIQIPSESIFDYESMMNEMEQDPTNEDIVGDI